MKIAIPYEHYSLHGKKTGQMKPNEMSSVLGVLERTLDH